MKTQSRRKRSNRKRTSKKLTRNRWRGAKKEGSKFLVKFTLKWLSGLLMASTTRTIQEMETHRLHSVEFTKAPSQLLPTATGYSAPGLAVGSDGRLYPITTQLDQTTPITIENWSYHILNSLSFGGNKLFTIYKKPDESLFYQYFTHKGGGLSNQQSLETIQTLSDEPNIFMGQTEIENNIFVVSAPGEEISLTLIFNGGIDAIFFNKTSNETLRGYIEKDEEWDFVDGSSETVKASEVNITTTLKIIAVQRRWIDVKNLPNDLEIVKNWPAHIPARILTSRIALFEGNYTKSVSLTNIKMNLLSSEHVFYEENVRIRPIGVLAFGDYFVLHGAKISRIHVKDSSILNFFTEDFGLKFFVRKIKNMVSAVANPSLSVISVQQMIPLAGSQSQGGTSGGEVLGNLGEGTDMILMAKQVSGPFFGEPIGLEVVRKIESTPAPLGEVVMMDPEDRVWFLAGWDNATNMVYAGDIFNFGCEDHLYYNKTSENDQNTQCVDIRQINQLPGSETIHCQEIDNLESKSCLKCEPNFQLFFANNKRENPNRQNCKPETYTPSCTRPLYFLNIHKCYNCSDAFENCDRCLHYTEGCLVCEPGYALDKKAQKCLTCSEFIPFCQKCVLATPGTPGYNNTGFECRGCLPGMELSPDYECTCHDGQYLKREGISIPMCVSCSVRDPHCQKCDLLTGFCLSCPDGFSINIQGRCSFDCPPGKYLKAATGKECSVCATQEKKGCSKCEEVTGKCLECESGYQEMHSSQSGENYPFPEFCKKDCLGNEFWNGRETTSA